MRITVVPCQATTAVMGSKGIKSYRRSRWLIRAKPRYAVERLDSEEGEDIVSDGLEEQVCSVGERRSGRKKR